MKIYKATNNFANYGGLQNYIVIANDIEEALFKAGEKLKKYALENRFASAKNYYKLMGLTPIDIFDHIDKPSYYDHFIIKCLSEDIAVTDVVRII